ncbi:MAG: glycosyltransferase [Lachnospiraceae bacterium]|nr:glycosyltransferase [Lachnospiraceae bacterium]
MVSIVMPAYNCEKFIGKAIKSVQDQTWTEWELIIIDDCSTDHTYDTADTYAQKDARIRLLRQEQNSGVACARNRGIQEAKGDMIAFLDCDDAWVSAKLEKQLELQRETGAEIIYCSYDFINENDETIRKPFIVPGITNYDKMLASSVISCSTALIKTSLLKKHLFQPEYYHEDYVLWMELLAIPVRAVGNREVLAHYRQLSGSRSNNKKNAAKQRWFVYRNVLHLGMIKSLNAFAKYALLGMIKYVL